MFVQLKELPLLLIFMDWLWHRNNFTNQLARDSVKALWESFCGCVFSVLMHVDYSDSLVSFFSRSPYLFFPLVFDCYTTTQMAGSIPQLLSLLCIRNFDVWSFSYLAELCWIHQAKCLFSFILNCTYQTMSAPLAHWMRWNRNQPFLFPGKTGLRFYTFSQHCRAVAPVANHSFLYFVINLLIPKVSKLCQFSQA